MTYLNHALFLITTVNMEVNVSMEMDGSGGSKTGIGLKGTVDPTCIEGWLTTCSNHKCVCIVLLIVVIAAAIGIGLGVHFGLLSTSTQAPLNCKYGSYSYQHVQTCCTLYDTNVNCALVGYGYYYSGSKTYCCS